MRVTRNTLAALLLVMPLLVAAVVVRSAAAAASDGDPDAALRGIADYAFGQSREGLVAIERLTLAAGATATSPDGFEKDGQAGGDQAAIDGNSGTYWDEANGKKRYILKVELKEPAEVSAISILAYQHHNFAPKDFEILCDGKTVKAVRGARYDENQLVVTFPAVRCKTLELKITGYYGASPAIRELEIYHVDPSGGN